MYLKASNLIESWKTKDIICYSGHEPRRNPHTKWTMTIIQRNHKSVRWGNIYISLKVRCNWIVLLTLPSYRSKDGPWFGCVIGGNDTRDLNKLMSVLMRVEFGDKIFPDVKLIAAWSTIVIFAMHSDELRLSLDLIEIFVFDHRLQCCSFYLKLCNQIE